ncbi:MAG: hypothetical protein AB7S26_06705 [Sandaracinaceae bacterium]
MTTGRESRAALLFLLILAVAPPASAQVGLRVSLRAPEPTRSELTEPLAIELAARGGTIVESADEPFDFAVEIFTSNAGLGLELVTRATGEAHRVPRLDAEDGRSLALVIASLIDEARAGLPLGAEPDESEAAPSASASLGTPLADPATPNEPFFTDPALRPRPPTPARPPEEHGAYLAFGVAAHFLTTGGYGPSGGAGARVAGGYRFRDFFRIGLSGELAFLTQEDFTDAFTGASKLEVHPLLMACLEAIGSFPIGGVSIALGAEGCALGQEWSYQDFSSSVPITRWAGGYGAGGIVGVGVTVADGYAIWLRADLQFVEPEIFTQSELGMMTVPRQYGLLGHASALFMIE